MQIQISHQSAYSYDKIGGPIVQALRLTPPTSPGQAIVTWHLSAPGIENAATYIDAFGNRVHLITPGGRDGATGSLISVQGVIATKETAGVVGNLEDFGRAAIYLRETHTTKASPEIIAMANSVRNADEMPALHALMARIHADVAYDTDATKPYTTASEAYAQRRGVCQDHAQIFAAAARHLRIPARYVTGYLLTDQLGAGSAHHAWAEALVPHLGWVGFDPANLTCPTEGYVRLAVGLDAGGAAPIRGVRLGPGAEMLSVAVMVQEAGSQ